MDDEQIGLQVLWAATTLSRSAAMDYLRQLAVVGARCVHEASEIL
jgi:hypothetical protein